MRYRTSSRALRADGWTEIIVALSIFVPIVLASALAVWVIRGAKHDPDEQRRRAVQADHRARHDSEPR